MLFSIHVEQLCVQYDIEKFTSLINAGAGSQGFLLPKANARLDLSCTHEFAGPSDLAVGLLNLGILPASLRHPHISFHNFFALKQRGKEYENKKKKSWPILTLMASWQCRAMRQFGFDVWIFAGLAHERWWVLAFSDAFLVLEACPADGPQLHKPESAMRSPVGLPRLPLTSPASTLHSPAN